MRIRIPIPNTDPGSGSWIRILESQINAVHVDPELHNTVRNSRFHIPSFRYQLNGTAVDKLAGLGLPYGTVLLVPLINRLV
jgi:hypothetical protein